METINFTLNERYRKIIEKIKKQAGLGSDQEVLRYILDDAEANSLDAVDDDVQKVLEENEGNLRDGLLSEFVIRDGEVIPNYKKELSSKAEIIPKSTHEDHGIITKGMVDLLHNKIFPVVYVLYDFKYELDQKKTGEPWVNLEFYRYDVALRASFLADKLDETEQKRLSDGLPHNRDYFLKSRSKNRMKKSWSKKIKEEQADAMVLKSRDRFANNIVANDSLTKVGGACVEWGFIEVGHDIEKDDKTGKVIRSSYIRLTNLGKEFVGFANSIMENMVKYVRKMELAEIDVLKDEINTDFKDEKISFMKDMSSEFEFTNEEVKFLCENIFNNLPLELEAMRIMINEDTFGNEEISGAEILKEKFWKLQEKYLRTVESEKFRTIMEKPEEENMFLKKDKSSVKARALSVMARLREMGLFRKEAKAVYQITDRGIAFRELFDMRKNFEARIDAQIKEKYEKPVKKSQQEHTPNS